MGNLRDIEDAVSTGSDDIYADAEAGLNDLLNKLASGDAPIMSVAEIYSFVCLATVDLLRSTTNPTSAHLLALSSLQQAQVWLSQIVNKDKAS